jgi:3-hydroxybutyryl-CoA dehydrogenase
MSVRVVGVVGGGVMGSGVAQNLAQCGYRVVLLDTEDAILQRARQEIANSLRLHRLLQKEKQTASTDQLLERITFSTAYKLLEEADFVVENVTEKWWIKKGVYEHLDRVCPAHCVFAANTSAIPITRLAAATNRAGKVIGVHFMNPVLMKPVVEVIRGYHTSEETITITRELLESIGKTAIIVNDSPGFVTNRVLMLTINEAIFLLLEQVASVEDIDRIFKTCFGHKMGPLETADLIGLDTILFSIEVLYESFNDSKFRPCPLLRKMVDAGLYGRKSGQGFYTY